MKKSVDWIIKIKKAQVVTIIGAPSSNDEPSMSTKPKDNLSLLKTCSVKERERGIEKEAR